MRKQQVRRYVLEIIKWGSRVLNRNLLNGRGKAALDVGCAYGYATNVLESLGYEAYGIDISRYGVRQANKNYTGHFLVCDAQTSFPFKKKTFDLLTCFDVLEHLEHPLKTMGNMFDLCKDVMICATPNKAVEKPIRKIMRDYDETHINAKFPDEWEKGIQNELECGFIKVETFYDLTLKVGGKLLFFKSFKVPYFGLTIRVLVKK